MEGPVAGKQAVGHKRVNMGMEVEEFVDDLRDDRAQRTEAGLVVSGVGFDELGKVAVDTLPEGRLLWVAGAVKLHGEPPVAGLDNPTGVLVPRRGGRVRRAGRKNCSRFAEASEPHAPGVPA